MTHIGSKQLLAAAFAAVALQGWAAPGDLDTWNPNVTGGIFNVFAGAIQPVDAKIIIGGSFSSVASTSRLNTARLNPSGTILDSAFAPGTAASGTVYCAAVQPDGKVLIGGLAPDTGGGLPPGRIVRLNVDGTVDTTFNPGTGPNDLVHAIAVQPNGKIIIGGLFTSVNGVERNRIARLDSNGSVESLDTFNPGTGANDHVYTVALQPDGRILLGGLFTSVAGEARAYIARLESNGALENTATFNTGTNNRVYCITVQPDGKILLGGIFTTVGGQSRVRIARLESNGSVESLASFDPGAGADDLVNSIALQVDGKILLGGGFFEVRGTSRIGVARLHANGTLDGDFDPGAGATDLYDVPSVNGVTLQSDGKVLLVGGFTSYDGTPRNLMARLQNDSATQSMNITYSNVQWMRSGAAPELSQVIFELSNGGSTWSTLGTPTAIPGGWQLGGLALPNNGSIRARGRTSGGYFNGSSGMVQQVQTFTVSPPTPVESWRLTHFGTTVGTGNAADTATPDNDGIANLLKYALCVNPGASGNAQLPQAQTLGSRLAITFTRDPARNDISIHVEVADTLALLQSSPTLLASSINGAITTGAGVITETEAGGGRKTVEVRDSVTINTSPYRFMRLRVVR
jgi:uncharacterized delta-60 repeat protein